MSVAAMTQAGVQVTKQFAARTQNLFNVTTEAIQDRSSKLASFVQTPSPAEKIVQEGLTLRGARLDIKV
ncbi:MULTISPECIES: hypothetical protein [Rhodospirillales]|uniref:Uncharacterized protein n=2 Tax=Rhodospirillales TaxID=204441 RepID=B6ITZ1_RHOCS|nr:hypothetical protein [Rhodospirillum centenum]ACI99527.1 hypothetical protein RC1_2140 [Rhodospirillum centenum SW]